MIGGFLLAGGIAQKLKYRHGVKVAIGLCLAIVFFMLTYVLTFLGYFISASLLSIGGQ